MIPIGNIYYLLCYAWDCHEELGTVDLQELQEFDRVENLFGSVLARGVIRVSRRGLDRRYIPFREELPGVRGKIELTETIKRASLVRHRLTCSFEELSHDVLHNQIIAATLDLLIEHQPLDEKVRQRVRIAASRMAGVSRPRLTRQLFSRVQLDGNRRAYRFLINVCRLLFDTRLIDSESGESVFAGIDLERMALWRVFENFAARFYELEQRHYRVRAQTQVQWWALETFGRSSEGRVPIMKPDLLLESEDRRIILDTKFYKNGGLGDEINAKLHAGNLYQLFAYVMNRERSHRDGPQHEGILLYPTVGEETRVEFKTHDYRFQGRSVDLSTTPTEIHRAMLETVDLHIDPRPSHAPQEAAGGGQHRSQDPSAPA